MMKDGHQRICRNSKPLMIVALLWLFWCWPATVFAQTEVSSAQARTAQYVFVIDDSGSMSKRTTGGPAADPDRLSVFAVRSLLSMLDDVDEATVVRLNGPIEQAAMTPIAPLSQNRKTLNDKLSLTGTLANYAGKQTPCTSALDAVKRALNAAYRPNVAQVVFFLTDGECTGALPSPASWLGGVNSKRDGLFKFYLLRFAGRQYTSALASMAIKTQGQATEVSAVDPTSILQPFAAALSRSQGYEAYLLKPSSTQLGAHSGARRVRLLAVAPDQGQPLAFKINPARQGKAPTPIGATRTGVHQYQDGRRFRYAALDYKPGNTPVSIRVTGAGNQWKVVAVPEYRLYVSLNVQKGSCAAPGKSVQFVEVGGRVCVTVSLINEQGKAVAPSALARGIRASVRYTAPGQKPVDLPVNRVGQKVQFTLERVNMERGDHIFRPSMKLPVPGSANRFMTLVGGARTLQVSSRSITPVPAQFDLGVLVPGSEQYSELTLKGNFPASRARLVVEGRRNVPECVTFALSGVAEGKGQQITANQTYTLAVKVAPYCGQSSFKKDLQTALRIEFDAKASARAFPSVVLPLRATLINNLELPRVLRFKLDSGESKTQVLKLTGNHKQSVSFKVIVPEPNARKNWPGKDLDVIFVDNDGKPLMQNDELARTRKMLFAKKGQKQKGDALHIRVVSDACCQEGKYRTELALIPTAGSREVIRVPVEIQVRSAGMWRCWGPVVIYSLIGLLVLLLLLYIANMFRQSHFLNRDLLAAKLVPLRWDEWGEATPYTRGADDVKRMVRKNMPLHQRILSWFKANPFVFGLPGNAYYETVQLYLEPARDISRSRLALLGDRDTYQMIRSKPSSNSGRMFCTARGGLLFFCVPDRDQRLGRLVYEDEFGSFDDGGWGDELSEQELEVVRLRRDELLDVNAEREADTAAGWRIG